MPHTVSAADANRQFSEILGRAADGEIVTITRRGTAVAQLVPYRRAADDEAGGRAWERLLATLETGISLGGARFDRETLYDR